MSFADRLKEARRICGLSQEELALMSKDDAAHEILTVIRDKMA